MHDLSLTAAEVETEATKEVEKQLPLEDAVNDDEQVDEEPNEDKPEEEEPKEDEAEPEDSAVEESEDPEGKCFLYYQTLTKWLTYCVTFSVQYLCENVPTQPRTT